MVIEIKISIFHTKVYFISRIIIDMVIAVVTWIH